MQKITTVLLVALLAAMAGCASFQHPSAEKAQATVAPSASPVRTFTGFSDSLRCMDRLFLIHGVEPIYITSAGIPDMSAKGAVGNGARHMLMSTISNLAAQSKAVVFVDLPASPLAYPDASGVQQPHLETIYQHLTHILQKTLESHPHRRGFVYPDYYIVGATSQVEDKIVSGRTSGLAALAKGDGGVGREGSVSMISLDMNVADATNFQLLNGLTATNSIAVMRETESYDFGMGGILRKAGMDFAVQLDKRQGSQQALRTLLELSTIELIGKLTQVPYWQCLQIEQTNPEMMTQARDWFNAMEAAERVAFVQKTLRSKGFYSGSINGVLDGATKEAVSRYQANESLIPSGRVDFDLYRILIGGELATGNQPKPVLPESNPAVTGAIEVEITALKPHYKLNDRFSFQVSVSRDAYVNCYYQGGNGKIIRVFPNQKQPDPYLTAGRKLEVPAQSALFDIVLEHPRAREAVMCLATHDDIGLQLPDTLKVRDLQPVALDSLEAVSLAYREMTGKQGLHENSLMILVE